MKSRRVIAAEIAALVGSVFWCLWWIMYTIDGAGWRRQLDMYFVRIDWGTPHIDVFIDWSHGDYTWNDIAWVDYSFPMEIFSILLKIAIFAVVLGIGPICLSLALDWLKEHIDNMDAKNLAAVLGAWITWVIASFAWINATLNYESGLRWRYAVDYVFAWSGLVDTGNQLFNYGIVSLKYGIPAYLISSGIKWIIFFGVWAIILLVVAVAYEYFLSEDIKTSWTKAKKVFL